MAITALTYYADGPFDDYQWEGKSPFCRGEYCPEEQATGVYRTWDGKTYWTSVRLCREKVSRHLDMMINYSNNATCLSTNFVYIYRFYLTNHGLYTIHMSIPSNFITDKIISI